MAGLFEMFKLGLRFLDFETNGVVGIIKCLQLFKSDTLFATINPIRLSLQYFFAQIEKISP